MASDKETQKNRSPRGRFTKGNPGGPGRPRGSLNKTTTDLRAAILEALDRAGGVSYLQDLALASPSSFVTLLARLLPTAASIDVTTGAALSVWPDEIDLTPQSFPTMKDWDAFFSGLQKDPVTIVVTGGAREGVYPIARRRNGQWICGGLPDAEVSVLDSGNVLYDPDPDI